MSAFPLRPDKPITAVELRKIADATETILATNADPATVSIPFLHLQSAHPNVVSRYAGVFDQDRSSPRLVRSVAARARTYALALWEGGATWTGDPLPSKTDVLFISHFLKPDQARTVEDLYIGDLPARLQDAGVGSITALIDHTKTRRKVVERDWVRAPTPRLLLSRIIGIRDEWANGARLSAAAGRLRSLCLTDPIEAAVARIAAAESANGGSRAALRIADQIRKLVRRLQPGVIVATYEGHSWERLAFAAARDAKPDICCVGYSHATLFPFQKAMAARLGHGYDPDVILTAGDVTRDQLREIETLRGVPIETLGSTRVSQPMPPSEARESLCLLLPEGLISECEALIRPAILVARAHPSLRFKIRLHPVLPRERLLAAVPEFLDLPPNVEWSASPYLEVDLAAAKWALYRGSTAVIQAVQHGVRPIYLAMPNEEFCLDPLAGLTTWRLRASGAESLSELLMASQTGDNHERLELAQEYCGRYFMPMNPCAIAEIVSAARSS